MNGSIWVEEKINERRSSSRSIRYRSKRFQNKNNPDTFSPPDQNRQTKLLGNTCRPCCLLASSRSSPLHQPSSGVEVTAMMSPDWKSNSSSIEAV